MEKGEYQLTNVLENMMRKGKKFVPGDVLEWLDCGNVDAAVYTNQRILEIKQDGNTPFPASAKNENSVIVDPCFIGENVILLNSVIGPYVSISENTKLENCVIRNSIIQANTKLSHVIIEDSMIGNNVEFSGMKRKVSIGDFSTHLA